MSGTTAKKVRKLVREEKGIYKLYSDGSVLLENVRVSYPWVAKGQKNVNEKTGVETIGYSLTAMLPKATHRPAQKTLSEIIVGFEKRMTEKGKGKGGKPFKYPASRKFIKNGDAKDEDGEPLFPDNPEYQNHFIVKCNSPDQPQMRGRKRDPETGKPERLTSAQATKLIYGGSICSVLIEPWPMDNDYGIRANAKLVAVQWKAKGEPFGDRRPLDDDDIDDSLDADDDDGLADDGGFDDDDDAPL